MHSHLDSVVTSQLIKLLVSVVQGCGFRNHILRIRIRIRIPYPALLLNPGPDPASFFDADLIHFFKFGTNYLMKSFLELKKTKMIA